MSDRLVLALDGSTQVCSAALLRVGRQAAARWEVVARRSEVNGRGQAKVLLRLVDEMLEEIDAQPADLGTIVVGVGPGTFTGVRIAVATARGLALGLAVPVLGASTLSALAVGAVDEASERERGEWTRLVPIVDARRHQVFYAVYEASGLGGPFDGPTWTRRRPLAVCEQGELAAALGEGSTEGVLVVGEDRALVGELPADVGFAVRQIRAEYLVAGQHWLREASETGSAPSTTPQPSETLMPGAPELVKPIYVRAPDADLHITKMKDPWADDRR